MTRLLVDFCGELHRLSPGDELTFGRAAQLEIDDNPYMHRLVGRFFHQNDRWWLRNEGRTIAISMVDAQTRARSYVTPGSEAAITLASGVARFEAGPTSYEIDLLIEGSEVEAEAGAAPRTNEGSDTITVAELPLVASQRRLLAALAEHMLLNPTADRIVVPTNRQVATRLGLRITQFNRGLDRLCAKLTRQGVTGLAGDSGDLAMDRRERLVQWAITNGVVTSQDLAALDDIEPLEEP